MTVFPPNNTGTKETAMRYIFLVYTAETPDGLPPEEEARIYAGHAAVIGESKQKGILIGAEPLAPTSSATTVRIQNGKPLVLDGPFAETKEQLAGYYIMECENLDEAIEWAAKIPTECLGRPGCIEIRPMRWQQNRAELAGDRS
jgi:hypothetical protein